jgi:hypothetical protein
LEPVAGSSGQAPGGRDSMPIWLLSLLAALTVVMLLAAGMLWLKYFRMRVRGKSRDGMQVSPTARPRAGDAARPSPARRLRGPA